MAHNPSMRASDVEREQAAAALQEHYAQGRLTREEFDERLEAAYAAKTVGELEHLTADLPAEDLHQLPVPAHEHWVEARRRSSDIRQAIPGGPWPWLWGTWGFATALNFSIWLLLTLLLQQQIYPWWIWVALPWGVVQLGAHVADQRRRGGH